MKRQLCMAALQICAAASDGITGTPANAICSPQFLIAVLGPTDRGHFSSPFVDLNARQPDRNFTSEKLLPGQPPGTLKRFEMGQIPQLYPISPSPTSPMFKN
jgi:hypothetical protein